MAIADVLTPLSSFPEFHAVGGENNAGKRIEFKVQKQARSNWCWAAVAASIGALYNKGGSVKGQCCLAVDVLKKPSCCDDPDSCNSGAAMDDALRDNGTLREPPEDANDLNFDSIVKEIEKNLVIGCGVATSSNGHALALYGWDISDGVQRVYLWDPLGPTLKLFGHNTFKTDGAEDYLWIRAYLTRRPSKWGFASRATHLRVRLKRLFSTLLGRTV
jgi:hypothetical protein